MRYTVLIILLIGTILFSCTNDKITPTDLVCEPDINYDNTMEAIINNSCAIPTCHVVGGNAPGVYTSYAGILVDLESGQVEDEVIVQRDMPRLPGVLSEEEFELFQCWLIAGHPEN